MVAGAFVGAGYETLGWMVTSLITGGVAAVGFLVVTASEPPVHGASQRPESSGVVAALVNPQFIAFGMTCLTNGYLMMLMLNMLVFNLRDRFEFSAGQVGTVFIATTMVRVRVRVCVCACWLQRSGMASNAKRRRHH